MKHKHEYFLTPEQLHNNGAVDFEKMAEDRVKDEFAHYLAAKIHVNSEPLQNGKLFSSVIHTIEDEHMAAIMHQLSMLSREGNIEVKARVSKISRLLNL